MAASSENFANHLVLHDVSWESYTRLLEALGDRRLRHAYDRGTLEMMSPLKEHEWIKKLIGRMIEAASLELEIPIQSVGSMTLRRDKKRRGLEPDECYYVGHESQVRSKSDYEPERDPPPDLAIEVDVTHASLSRLEIYASLGIPEVWRAAREGVIFHRLNRAGRYVEESASKAFPLLTPTTIQRFLAMRGDKNETTLMREFVRWVRAAKRSQSA
jgi:Uma2 family endonuclease